MTTIIRAGDIEELREKIEQQDKIIRHLTEGMTSLIHAVGVLNTQRKEDGDAHTRD